jgi:hypothetical protein
LAFFFCLGLFFGHYLDFLFCQLFKFIIDVNLGGGLICGLLLGSVFLFSIYIFSTPDSLEELKVKSFN